MSENGEKSNGLPSKEGSNGEYVGYKHPPKHGQIKPGEVRNPEGRPKGTGLTDRLRSLLEENKGAGADAFVAKAYDLALKGDFRFWDRIYDRVEGPIKQQLEASILTHMKAIDRESFRGV